MNAGLRHLIAIGIAVLFVAGIFALARWMERHEVRFPFGGEDE